MHGTETRGHKEDTTARQAPTVVTTQTFSELELTNHQFKRIAWGAALLLIIVVTVLILELSGVIPY